MKKNIQSFLVHIEDKKTSGYWGYIAIKPELLKEVKQLDCICDITYEGIISDFLDDDLISISIEEDLIEDPDTPVIGFHFMHPWEIKTGISNDLDYCKNEMILKCEEIESYLSKPKIQKPHFYEVVLTYIKDKDIFPEKRILFYSDKEKAIKSLRYLYNKFKPHSLKWSIDYSKEKDGFIYGKDSYGNLYASSITPCYLEDKPIEYTR